MCSSDLKSPASEHRFARSLAKEIIVGGVSIGSFEAVRVSWVIVSSVIDFCLALSY